MQKKIRNILIGLGAAILLAIGLYQIPPIHSRLAWRLDELRTRIVYFFNPPEEVVFMPTEQSQFTSTPRPTATPTTQTTPEFTPTVTFTPVPQSVILENVTFIHQMNRWNYCGPANLTMALQYWDWTGLPGDTRDPRDQIGALIKPGADDAALNFIERSNTDVNVMPYELVDFVNENTHLGALYRQGGDIELVKRLIAAGFPPIIEKGTHQVSSITNKTEWVGHYAFTTGYDDARQVFIFQDSYTPDHNISYERQGKNQEISYADYITGWRAFNYIFIVIYPPEQEAALRQVLGPWVDPTWALQNALQVAEEETQTLSGTDLFFAWFNKGTSNVGLFEYGEAALAYDYAYANVYPGLPEGPTRPFRIMWYQTGPYFAYFYTSRYQDVVNLADATLKTINYPRSLEESLVWRARAKVALGYYEDGYADMRLALYYHPGFPAALQDLANWGVSP